MKRNIGANGFNNVVLDNRAVCGITGKRKLYSPQAGTSDHRLCDTPERRRSVAIDGVSLDDYFKDYSGTIDLIKMDIQGAEAEALAGASGVLKKNRNIKIIVEFWPCGLVCAGSTPADFLRLLATVGFRAYDLRCAGNAFVEKHPAELLKTYTVEKNNFTNLFCEKAA